MVWRAEAANADATPWLEVDIDADAALEDEEHRGGRVALAGDDVTVADVEPPTISDQQVGEFCAAQGFGKPSQQRTRSVAFGAMRLDHGLFARLERAIEIHKQFMGQRK